jgi:hypothetical protein
MPVEQYSSTSETIDAISSRVQAAHRPFAGAQMRLAIVPSATGPQFLTGTMVFAEQKLDDSARAEYRNVQLFEFWIEGQDDAISFLYRFFSGQERISGVPVLNKFTHTMVNHDASGHNASRWPSWLFTTSADSRKDNQRLLLDQQPTVSKGRPPFRSPADAVRSWVFHQTQQIVMANDVPYQDQFLVVIPDTRARFVSGRWSPGSLDVVLEANASLRDLELQILHVGSENRSANYSVQTEPMHFPVPDDARELLLYVVHKSDDLICMHSLNSVYRSFGKTDTIENEGVDFARELQLGENEIREFKPFIVPWDKKEFELVKSAVAFANSDGGTIFVGVDDEGVPQGVSEARKCFPKTDNPIEAQKARLKNLITENTKPVPSVTYTIVKMNGNPVVVAEVKKSSTLCSTHDNRAYVRRGATSRLADPQTEIPSLNRVPGIDFEIPLNALG